MSELETYLDILSSLQYRGYVLIRGKKQENHLKERNDEISNVLHTKARHECLEKISQKYTAF